MRARLHFPVRSLKIGRELPRSVFLDSRSIFDFYRVRIGNRSLFKATRNRSYLTESAFPGRELFLIYKIRFLISYQG